MLTDEQKAKWAEDLRSGDFKQCGYQLQKPDVDGKGEDQWCCLGVLANQLDPHAEHWDPDFPSLDECAGPLVEVLTVAQNDQCVKWNDTDGLSFAEIADKIEAGELERL